MTRWTNHALRARLAVAELRFTIDRVETAVTEERQRIAESNERDAQALKHAAERADATNRKRDNNEPK